MKKDSNLNYLRVVPTLNTLRRAKHPYNNPMGYATSNLWSDIRRTATKMPDAAYVHHRMEIAERIYPTVPLMEPAQRKKEQCLVHIVLVAPDFFRKQMTNSL